MAKTINDEELNKTENKSGTIEIISECPEGNEIINESTRFTAHNMCFKFKILHGEQPKSTNSFDMKSWTVYRFIENDYVATSTPQSIIIFIKQDLGAGSMSDLKIKYHKVAKAHANNFAQHYDLTLGEMQYGCKPHFTVLDTAIGQILSKQGKV